MITEAQAKRITPALGPLMQSGVGAATVSAGRAGSSRGEVLSPAFGDPAAVFEDRLRLVEV